MASVLFNIDPQIMQTGISSCQFPTLLDSAVFFTSSVSLSALPAEETEDQMYLNAATASADFIHAKLDNVENVVQDSIHCVQPARPHSLWTRAYLGRL